MFCQPRKGRRCGQLDISASYTPFAEHGDEQKQKPIPKKIRLCFFAECLPFYQRIEIPQDTDY
jgi:hypothetical protein